MGKHEKWGFKVGGSLTPYRTRFGRRKRVTKSCYQGIRIENSSPVPVLGFPSLYVILVECGTNQGCVPFQPPIEVSPVGTPGGGVGIFWVHCAQDGVRISIVVIRNKTREDRRGKDTDPSTMSFSDFGKSAPPEEVNKRGGRSQTDRHGKQRITKLKRIIKAAF